MTRHTKVACIFILDKEAVGMLARSSIVEFGVLLYYP
jgi:hypothetical protein